MMTNSRWFLPVFLSGGLLAQNGDKPNEVQMERVPAERIPPAPVLSPADQIASFQLPPGFRAELVASEPLVTTPVAMQFDHRGRLWVVEMNGYMPDTEGRGEQEPVGNVVILTDRDGDGRMDQRTVFLGGLVMPRSLMLFRDGALVAEPPNLWFARDTDGDGVCDRRELVVSDYATQDDPKLGDKANPEHASNSPTWALDNWIYSANHTTRYRWDAGQWRQEPTHFRGQYGLSQDDYGRLYFNSNSDQLRGDFVPGHYLARNPNLRRPRGINEQLVRDQRVWTARVNPGVNRGYQPNTLTAEGHLNVFTGACGPVVYRGDQFPEDFRNNVFLCEPTGNLVRRNRILEEDGRLAATNAYERAEFLASTDERFRPVNLANGPDGCLYIVDIARGLIQHRIYLTSYLRKQIESRNLQTPVNLGRIYRIVHAGSPRRAEALGAEPTTEELVARLSHPNGWWRDRAQQMLVERGDASVVPRLRTLAQASGGPAVGRLHALWTLEGLNAVDLPTVDAALKDTSAKVRIAGLRLLEPKLKSESERDRALLLLLQRAGFLPGEEQLQLLLTLGEAATPQTDNILRILLLNGPATDLRFDAAVSGLGGREADFVEALLRDPVCGPGKSEHAALVRRLAECVAVAGDPSGVARLVDLAAARKAGEWQQLALLDGILSTFPTASRGQAAPRIKPVRFNAEPRGWATLKAVTAEGVPARIARLAAAFTWPGDGRGEDEPAAAPLAGADLESFKRGQELYQIVCGACHQPHGNGQEGLAPPLRDSEWTVGSDQRLVRMVLHGIRDAITVKGQKWELNMPAFAEALDDQQIADALTYVRREWGHTAAPVPVDRVARIRAAEADRADSWTEAELLQIP